MSYLARAHARSVGIDSQANGAGDAIDPGSLNDSGCEGR
jgi:hypothetical protein